MHTQKLNLLKTCTALFFLGRRIKRQTRRLNRVLAKNSPAAPRTVHAAAALEKTHRLFDRHERRAVVLFLKLSANKKS